MLGVQVLLICLGMFLVGAEAAAPGFVKSQIVAAAEVTRALNEDTQAKLCARVQAHGGTCGATVTPPPSELPPPEAAQP
ncbi:hypothetical protein AQ619_06810 [Caulobacter henricii]|uniref:Uncharacterized protein n=1 Tax=Caulobacter henricii TaxID=69395 RepID=A0A0P0NYD1_9CAUL|nr:hypothetical protein AQ619_06810 [Caulobacter henricii]